MTFRPFLAGSVIAVVRVGRRSADQTESEIT